MKWKNYELIGLYYAFKLPAQQAATL